LRRSLNFNSLAIWRTDDARTTGGGCQPEHLWQGARDLVSLEVFPTKNYGALETGVHRISHPEIDNDQGDAKFVQLWRSRADGGG
jgi:hypothetical protein